MTTEQELALEYAHNSSIVTALSAKYQTIGKLLKEKPRGTMVSLLARGAIVVGVKKLEVKVNHNGDDNLKTWSDYKLTILKHLLVITSDDRLGPAREIVADDIHREHFIKFPRWPQVGGVQSNRIPLVSKGSYIYGESQVAFECSGFINIADKRPAARSFYTEFDGNPTIKLVMVNHALLEVLEAKALLDYQAALQRVTDKENNSLKMLNW